MDYITRPEDKTPTGCGGYECKGCPLYAFCHATGPMEEHADCEGEVYDDPRDNIR